MEEAANFKKQPILEHIKELRNRLVIVTIWFFMSVIICYYFSSEIYNFLIQPLYDSYTGEKARRIIYTGLTEAFFTYIKLAFFAALILTIPVIAFQIYGFLSPALYKKEKKFLIPFLIASPTLFILGACLVYYMIFPVAWKFFLSFELHDGNLPIELEARISEYLSLVMTLIIAFGISFQLPIILVLLVKFGLLDVASLKKKRRLAIVLIFIIAAVLTPPDIISQIGLAIPLIILYELSIVACNLIRKPE